MAYIYGSPGQDRNVKANARGGEMLLRLALPLVFLFILASMGLQAFLHGFHAAAAFFMAFFVLLLLRFDELGLTLSNHLARKTRHFQSDQVAAQALSQLPDEYHVFHGLDFGSGHIDHAVVGPNGFFLVSTKTHIGKVTVARDRLRLNGWPFLGDPINRCWRQSQTLMKHLDLHASGAIQPCPVLCFSRSSVAADRFVRGVMIAQASTLTRMILEQESSLPSDKLLQLTALLAPLVRVKPWENGAAGMQEHDGFGTEDVTQTEPAFACEKCRHVPSALEAELFPGECPRCGRLHSGDRGSVMNQGVLRPAPAHILLTCVTVAIAAGLLAYQAGLLDQTQSEAMIPPVESPTRSVTQPMAQAPVRDNAPAPLPSGPAKPAEKKTAEPAQVRQDSAAGRHAGNETGLSPAPAENSTSLPAPSDEAKPREAAVAHSCPTDVTASAATESSTGPAPAAQAAESRVKRAGLRPFEGTLTIVTTRSATLWLTNDDTRKRFGPFETEGRKELDIVLPKGCYSVVLLENGKRRRTTVSFLSDAGRLEF